MVARVFLDFPMYVVIIQSRTCIATKSLLDFSSSTSSVCFCFPLFFGCTGLHCCKQGLLFTAVHLLLVAVASLVAEYRL